MARVSFPLIEHTLKRLIDWTSADLILRITVSFLFIVAATAMVTIAAENIAHDISKQYQKLKRVHAIDDHPLHVAGILPGTTFCLDVTAGYFYAFWSVRSRMTCAVYAERWALTLGFP